MKIGDLVVVGSVADDNHQLGDLLRSRTGIIPLGFPMLWSPSLAE